MSLWQFRRRIQRAALGGRRGLLNRPRRSTVIRKLPGVGALTGD
jgi:hypothetical protein